MFTLRHERPDDGPHIDALLDASFGPGRFAKTAYRLREGVECIDALSWVAEEAGEIRDLNIMRPELDFRFGVTHQEVLGMLLHVVGRLEDCQRGHDPDRLIGVIDHGQLIVGVCEH